MSPEELNIITNLHAQTNKMFMQLSSELKIAYKRIEHLESDKPNKLITLTEAAEMLNLSADRMRKNRADYPFFTKFIKIGREFSIRKKHISKYINDLEKQNENIGTLASS